MILWPCIALPYTKKPCGLYIVVVVNVYKKKYNVQHLYKTRLREGKNKKKNL